MSTQAEDVTLVEHEELPATKSRTEESDAHTSASALNSGQEENNNNNQHTVRTAPVYYHAKSGPQLTEETVVISANGHSMIVTPQSEDTASQQRPLCHKDIKFLKIFSVVAILLFFPTGIAALVFALRADKAFTEGAQRGDMTIARKHCKFCERLIVVSLVLGLLTYVFIFALVEKTYAEHHETYHHGYGH